MVLPFNWTLFEIYIFAERKFWILAMPLSDKEGLHQGKTSKFLLTGDEPNCNLGQLKINKLSKSTGSDANLNEKAWRTNKTWSSEAVG